VRVKIGRRWRTGTAALLADDNVASRLRQLPQFIATALRLFGTELITVRIDLDPV
jgi:hypothetical protein